MKRTFTLFFAMLLCLMGTVANAAVYGLPNNLKSQGGSQNGKAKAVAGYAGRVVGNNVYYIPTGRVFIKSHANPMYTANTTRDADTDMYLTSLSNVMGLAWGATNYWSIWNITYDASTETVTIVNEGNRDIMTPLQRYSNDATRDAGYLYYNISENASTGYGVGDCDDASKRNFVWTVNQDGYCTLKAQASGTNNYMYFDTAWNSGSNEKGATNTGDHVAKSGDNTTNNRNLWSIISVTAEDEAEMFARNVQELNGYVGGVVTLTNVENVEKLRSINDNTATTCEYLQDGTIDNKIGAADKMKEILDIIAAANEFGQELVEERPFFLENMSSYRPELYSRLVYNGTNGSAWRTARRASVDMNNANGVFYVAKDGGANVIWTKNGNNKRYITGRSGVPTSGNNVSNALHFEIDPVIPGIWRIRDTKYSGTDGKVYLTISQNNGNYFFLTHYEVTEPSTLWKFKTYTTFDYTLQADPAGSTSYCTGYTTYGQYLDSKLPASTGVKAYLASELVWDGNEMQITMREANHSQDEMKEDVYWLKAGYGYLITKPNVSKEEAGKVNDNQLARFIPDEDYPENGGNASFAEEDGVANWLSPIPNNGTVTEADWENWFYLTYVEEGKTYTHYNGNDVKGYGVGFYRLNPGKTFKRGKARISWENSFGDKSKYLDKASWKKPTGNVKGQMVFIDSEGETTDVLTIGADGNLFREENTYFDLSGRRVSEPSKGGIYIKNGKKVLY